MRSAYMVFPLPLLKTMKMYDMRKLFVTDIRIGFALCWRRDQREAMIADRDSMLFRDVRSTALSLSHRLRLSWFCRLDGLDYRGKHNTKSMQRKSHNYNNNSVSVELATTNISTPFDYRYRSRPEFLWQKMQPMTRNINWISVRRILLLSCQ